MPSIRKFVASPGSYMTPEGRAEVSAQRIKHWSDTINQMVGVGIKPPVSWGHVSTAFPATEDDATYWQSKNLAGKITGAEIDSEGAMFALVDVPGAELDSEGRMIAKATLADGRLVPSAIEEVSIAVRDWTDGSGRLWPDAPIHLALTPLPVIVPLGGQAPFETINVAPAQGQHFGLSNLIRFSKADDMPKADNPPAGEPSKSETPESEAGFTLPKLLALLAKCGITVPDDTTPENLSERLYVACTAKEADMSIDPLQGDPGKKDDKEGASKNQVKEADAGVYLSTLRASNPVMALLIDERDARDRTDLFNDIDACVKMGLPVARAKSFRERATAQRFSLGTDGKPVTSTLRTEVDLAKEILAANQATLQLFSGTREMVAPEEDTSETVTKWERVADEFAKNTRLPARAKTNA